MKNRYLLPWVFAKESLDFMAGYPRYKIWLYMPVAYAKYCYYSLGR